MPADGAFRALADMVLAVHFAIVLFVVGGLVLVVAGNRLGWSWVNRPWFRLAHLAAIAIVVAESWLGITCPLTTLESWLRSRGGAAAHDESFVGYWLRTLLFYEAPDQTVAATSSAMRHRPTRRSRSRSRASRRFGPCP
jgi:hypothetical protein